MFAAPRLHVWLTYLVGLLVLALIAFLFLGEIARKETVTGQVAPSGGILKLLAPHAGTVMKVYTSEGSAVAQGAELILLGSESDVGRLSARQLQRRIQGLEAELEQALSESALQSERLVLLESQMQRLQNLVKKRLVSRHQAEQARADYLQQKALTHSLARQCESLRRERYEALLQLPEGYAHAEPTTEQPEDARRGLVLTAPASGTVAALQATQGQAVMPGNLLLSILPTGSRLQAQLFVPTRALGFIQEGQAVRLRYAAFPYQRFGVHGGRVTEVSRAVLGPGEVASYLPLREPVCAVKVALDAETVLAFGKEIALRPGMLLDADIILDRQTLIRWILDPLYAVKGRW